MVHSCDVFVMVVFLRRLCGVCCHNLKKAWKDQQKSDYIVNKLDQEKSGLFSLEAGKSTGR